MALIKCPECRKDVSDKAKSCIHFGCPLEELRTDGIVKIKMPSNSAGILNIFGGFNICFITTIETEEDLWSGRCGHSKFLTD